MYKKLLILLLLFISASGYCQLKQSSYLGEAIWKKATSQQERQPFEVIAKTLPIWTNTSKDSSLSMVQEKINPETQTIREGATLPVIQSIQFTGKKLSPPKVYSATPLLNRDNAGFNISYTDKKHGFPKVYTTDMAEDDAHNIWMATDDGLIRYDGNQYFVYDQSNGLPFLSDYSIVFDQQKRLWLASGNGAYFLRNDSLFTIQSQEINFSTLICTKVETDKINNVWISTISSGMIKIAGAQISIYDKRCGLPTNSFHTVLLDKNDNIYLGSGDHGLILIEKNRIRCFFEKSKKLLYPTFITIYENEDGVWAGAFFGGLIRMGSKDTVRYSIDGKFNERIYGIGKKSNGIWISCFSKGLCYFDRNKLLVINQNNGLVSNFPFRIFTDSFQNLWVTNGSTGFSRVNETNFYQTNYSNPNISFVNKILSDQNNNYWITTYGRGLIKHNGNKATYYSMNPEKKFELNLLQYINDAMIDKSGNLWIANVARGITRVTNNRFTFLTSPSINQDWNTYAIKQDTMHSIWFNISSSGLIQYENNKFWLYSEKSGLLNNNITKLFLDNGKNIHWSFSEGFQRLSKKSIETFYIGNQLFKDKVNDMISLDQNSHLLATTINGLILIHQGKVYQFSNAQGFASNNIKTMIQDRTNKIWITTEKGIESFRINNLSVTDHEVFNESNGSYVLDAKYTVLDTTGIPFWSEREHKLVFDKRFTYTNKNIPIITYSRIESNNQIRSENDNINILPNQKINIDYKTIYWGRENYLKLTYLLISNKADTTERSIQNSGTIIINDLIPDTYKILIKAADNNEVFYSHPLSFEVRAFWYNTQYFRFVFASLIITGIILYFRRKAKRQLLINTQLENRVNEQTTLLVQEKDALLKSNKTIDQQNKEKDILIDEINHRVKNNLQFISAMVEMQIRNHDINYTNEALVDTGRRIKAMSLVHELLYNKKEHEGLSMKAYVHELSDNLKEMALDDSNPVQIEMEVEDLLMDSKTSLALGMIISELVSNSFKHAFTGVEEPKVTIKLSKNASSGIITLEVTDNGNGYQHHTEKKGGLGSRLVDIFSRQLEGEYAIESKGHFSYVLQFKTIES